MMLPVPTVLLADYVACCPTHAGAYGRSNKGAPSNHCAKQAAADSANSCSAERGLLGSTHSRTSDKYKNKSKHNQNNRDTFHIASPRQL
jgi:hypothetical protein